MQLIRKMHTPQTKGSLGMRLMEPGKDWTLVTFLSDLLVPIVMEFPQTLRLGIHVHALGSMSFACKQDSRMVCIVSCQQIEFSKNNVLVAATHYSKNNKDCL